MGVVDQFREALAAVVDPLVGRAELPVEGNRTAGGIVILEFSHGRRCGSNGQEGNRGGFEDM
jgi:hypothetical protein